MHGQIGKLLNDNIISWLVACMFLRVQFLHKHKELHKVEVDENTLKHNVTAENQALTLLIN